MHRLSSTHFHQDHWSLAPLSTLDHTSQLVPIYPPSKHELNWQKQGDKETKKEVHRRLFFAIVVPPIIIIMQSVFLVSVWTALVFVTSVVHFHKHRYHSPRCVVDAFAPVMPRLVAGRTRSAAIITTANNNFAGRHGSAATVAVCNLSSEPNDYLEKASRLRQEASDLESKLLQDNERNKLGRRFAEDEVSEPLPPIYKTMDNSVWTLTYRFAST